MVFLWELSGALVNGHLWHSSGHTLSQLPAMLLLPREVCRRCVASRLLGGHTWAVRLLSLGQPSAAGKNLSKHVRPQGGEGFTHKAREATRTTTYTAVVLVGIGVTGLMMYTIFRELLSSFSPQTVYTAAVEKCSAHPRVTDFLGDAIKGFGEESRRGRRTHISHMGYEVDGSKGFRIKFHLKGPRRTATAHGDARETPGGGWAFRYLFVQLDSYPHEVIVIEDNRETLFGAAGEAQDTPLPLHV